MNAGADALTFVVLCLPFIGALAAPILTRLLAEKAAWLLAILPALAFWHFLSMLDTVSTGGTVTGGYDWISSYGIRFSWMIDGLSATFALLITGIGTLIVLYSGGYMKGHPQQGRFFSFILMFMGAMLGLVVSDSLLTLFVYWELTSITSFLLIGFDHTREASRRAALQALVVTGGGGLMLLAGLLLIWNLTGATQLSDVLASHDLLRESPLYLAVFILILGGAFTKSAQVPFHFWLPNAMEAPTPVSAYLHSATMVKAGVYLLMRLNPVLGDTVLWETVLPLFGGATLIVGTLLAVRQTDLKLMLAYTTVSSLGLLVMLTGFGTEKAIEAAVLYLLAHSMFKGCLFMVAGVVDHESGTRDITRLSGLAKAMPVTFAAALAAAFSMGGLPPFVGFLAKEEIYAGIAAGDPWSIFITVVAIIGNALMFAIAFAVALKPFLGPKVETPKHAHEGPILLIAGPVILAATGLLAAIFSGAFHHAISSPMASAVAGEPVDIYVSLIPHVGLPLALSGITIALAVAIYLAYDRARAGLETMFTALGSGPDTWFDGFISGLAAFAYRITRFIQSGKLDVYMTVTFIAVAVVLLVPPFVFGELPSFPLPPEDVMFHEWAIIFIAIVGLLAVLGAKNRLTAIVSLGIQGFAVAVIFLLFGAPDLSFTQFMVETLSVVILALVMTRLRLSPSDHRPTREKIIDGTIATACGLGFGMLLLKATEVSFDASLTRFFNEFSKTVAHGKNVVNVIIVDFRGTDTLGEIAVVTITGLAILALIRIRVAGRRPIADNTPDKPAEAARP